MLSFGCFAPVKRLAVKTISKMTYTVSKHDVKQYSAENCVSFVVILECDSGSVNYISQFVNCCYRIPIICKRSLL